MPVSLKASQIYPANKKFRPDANILLVKFIYSKKVTEFCEISTLLLSYVVPVKSNVEILHNFVTFSEYMNLTTLAILSSWLSLH